MALRLYLNHNVPRAVAEGLALRDVDVLTAYADGSHESLDPILLDRATELGRVLVSMDDDLLKEAARRQKAGIDFAGVLYGHQLSCSIGHLFVISSFSPRPANQKSSEAELSICHSRRRHSKETPCYRLGTSASIRTRTDD